MTTDYGMSTEFGQDAVAAIVRTAKTLNYSREDVYKDLESLAARFPEDFAEATDSAVVEAVYFELFGE